MLKKQTFLLSLREGGVTALFFINMFGIGVEVAGHVEILGKEIGRGCGVGC